MRRWSLCYDQSGQFARGAIQRKRVLRGRPRPNKLIEDRNMTSGEAKVIGMFRFYGVFPYQMLCLNRKTQQELKGPLSRLIEQGLIVREGRNDGYHLTPSGYDAVMRLDDAGTDD